MEPEVLLAEDYRVKAERTMHEEVYKLIATPNPRNLEQTPFLTLKDAFMWAFTLGVREKKRTPLNGPREGIFWFLQFDKNIDLPCLKMVALADTEDIAILLREDEILNIAEEYANTGIRLIRDEILNQSGEPLWNLLELAQK